MTVTAFRVQHFMGFEDSGWLELRPITLLFGRNSSGKSALIRALLLLRQSLKMEPGSGALLFVSDDGYDFGDYTDANIREVGFGLAQMLPVVVQAVLAQPGNTLIIEQPELHLHPRAQADLTDLFIAMSHRGLRFLIETHSEHMLLRLRRRIAETAAGLIARQQSEHLVSDSLIAYFVDRTDGYSTAERIKINHLGKMSSPPGFKGFFADDLMELAQLNNAVMKAQEDEGSQ